MASDDAALARLFFYDTPEYKRHPNYTKTDQLPISEVITGLPRPYHHMGRQEGLGIIIIHTKGKHTQRMLYIRYRTPLFVRNYYN